MGPAPTQLDRQLAVDQAVRPLRDAIREMRTIAAEALADGGAHRPPLTALADVSRIGAAALEAR